MGIRLFLLQDLSIRLFLSQELSCGWPKIDACHHCVGEQALFLAMGVQHCCGLDEPVVVGVTGCEAERN